MTQLIICRATNQTLQNILYIANSTQPKYIIMQNCYWQSYIFLSFKLPPTLKPSIIGHYGNYSFIKTYFLHIWLTLASFLMLCCLLLVCLALETWVLQYSNWLWPNLKVKKDKNGIISGRIGIYFSSHRNLSRYYRNI